jgi:hypothetical protein
MEPASTVLPGFTFQSYKAEICGKEAAWELIGRDATGRCQRLDISDSGQVIMIEPAGNRLSWA